MGRGADDNQSITSKSRKSETSAFAVNTNVSELTQAGWSEEEARASESFSLIEAI